MRASQGGEGNEESETGPHFLWMYIQDRSAVLTVRGLMGYIMFVGGDGRGEVVGRSEGRDRGELRVLCKRGVSEDRGIVTNRGIVKGMVYEYG